MRIDKSLEFSSAQALTATADSTNVIDMASDAPVGPGEPLYIVAQLDVAADDTDADETYSVTVETDDNAAFSSAEVLAVITFTRGDVAGTRKVFGFTYTNQRYLQLLYTLGGTTPSMTVSAWLSADMASAFTALPKALNS